MARTFVKVCGITTFQQLDWAIELGYDAIGLMRVPSSPRYVNYELAKELAQAAKGRILSFGVGLTLDQVEDIRKLVDTIQLYEEVNVESFALASTTSPQHPEKLNYWFYDASHGSGRFEEIPEWVSAVDTKVVIAGGLTPENVAGVVKKFQPYGLDVSSGVEAERGVKDRNLMENFIQAVRSAE